MAVVVIGYFVLVARAYRVADMSLTYPLMRGTAPLLVALASTAWVGEPLSGGAWIGVGVLCAGILSMAMAVPRGTSRAGFAPALGNAIAGRPFTMRFMDNRKLKQAESTT